MNTMHTRMNVTAVAAALVGLAASANAQTPAPTPAPPTQTAPAPGAAPRTRTPPAPERAEPVPDAATRSFHVTSDAFHLSDEIREQVTAATEQMRDAIEASRHALEASRDGFDFTVNIDDWPFQLGDRPLHLDFAFNDLQAVPAPRPPRAVPAPIAPGAPPMPPLPPRTAMYFEPINSADSLYEQARNSINNSRFERALEQLNRLIQQSDGKATAITNRVDAAMYWKAYTQLKMQATADALATLQDMQKKYAESRWIKDAKALEIEARQASGQRVSPEAQADDELKLLALRGSMRLDPDRAIPMIAQLMTGNSSVIVKENALFVLSQSRDPRAREIIVDAAKNSSNPDVQLRAVRYLGMSRGTDNRQVLNDIYRSTNDPAIKREVIFAYASSDAGDALSELARSEKDAALKRAIIRSLGNMGRTKTGDTLKALYAADSNVEVRKDIITALSSQQNDTALVELARAEKDPALKKQIVTALSTMKTKVATDYMLELLK